MKKGEILLYGFFQFSDTVKQAICHRVANIFWHDLRGWNLWEVVPHSLYFMMVCLPRPHEGFKPVSADFRLFWTTLVEIIVVTGIPLNGKWFFWDETGQNFKNPTGTAGLTRVTVPPPAGGYPRGPGNRNLILLGHKWCRAHIFEFLGSWISVQNLMKIMRFR